jgi:catecholate siderophore receptor
MGGSERTGGIRAYRKAALVLATSTLFASAAQAAEAANASGAESAADDADTIVVTAAKRDTINSLNSRLGDIRDAPQSISVIPHEVIEQQAATTMRDVLRNVSGISMAAGEGGVPAGDNLTLRGFSARTDIFIDGIRDFGSYTRDTFNVEQVEVVKGPSSAQTGRGSTGGYINLISKQPQRQSFFRGTAGVGTPEYWRGTADLNFGEDLLGVDGAAIRLNGFYHEADSPGRDFVEGKRRGIAPALAVGLGTSTRAILSYQLLKQNNVPDYGIPFVPNTVTVPALLSYLDKPAPVDRSNYYGLLDRDYEKTTTQQLTFALEHDLSDAVRISNVTRYGRSDRDSIYSSPRFLNNTSLQIRAQAQSRHTVDTLLINQTNLFAKFNTGGISHDLIAGLEVSKERSRNVGRTITEATTTNLFDPDPERPYTGTITPSGFTARAKAKTVAGYLFDTITLSPQWLISGGIRYDHVSTDFIGLPTTAEPIPVPVSRTDRIFSWRAGLTFKPAAGLSLYAGTGSSANPSFEGLTSQTINSSAANLKPEKSRTYEVGAKWDAMNGKLLLTGALFRIDKVNARIAQGPLDPTLVLDGKQRVDGFELGATGRITRNWEVVAAYTYLDSKILKSNTPTEVGKHLLNTPKHSFSAWTTYKLPFGLELGGGGRYVSSRFTSNANTRKVSGYWTADATAAYSFSKDVSLRLNVFNIFDKRYVDSLSGGHFVPGAGRSAVATLAFEL